MESMEDQASKEALLNARKTPRAEPSRRSRARERRGGGWGVLATIKATKEQTDGRYTLVEILAPEGYPGVLHVHHAEDEGSGSSRAS